jgi:UDP-galactopyranose mutase
VVVPYGEAGLVHIGDTPAEFIAAVDAAMAEDRTALMRRSDEFLLDRSWDRTWQDMRRLVEGVAAQRATRQAPGPGHPQRPAAAGTSGHPAVLVGLRGVE